MTCYDEDAMEEFVDEQVPGTVGFRDGEVHLSVDQWNRLVERFYEARKEANQRSRLPRRSSRGWSVYDEQTAEYVIEAVNEAEMQVIGWEDEERELLAHARDFVREALWRREQMTEWPEIVCLCGSSRFVEDFAVVAWELEKRGIVTFSLHLLPAWYDPDPDHQAEAEGVAEQMDELHLRKIDLADAVLVIDVDNYIGDSTRREIEYATANGVPVHYLSEKIEQGEFEVIRRRYETMGWVPSEPVGSE